MEDNIEIEKKNKSKKVIKRLSIFFGTLILLVIIFKFVTYFMPFFIAGIIALLIEPVIKFLMEKFKISRRVSSSIVIFLTIVIIVSLVVWGGIFLVNKLLEFSKEIGPLMTNISVSFENELEKISNKLMEFIPREVIESIITSISGFVSNAGLYIQNLLSSIMQFVLSVPTILLNVIVTILALVFFTKDKIYIIDAIEHHLPKKWIKNVSNIGNELITALGSYLKVYGKILLITFVELFLAFSILKAIGFELDNIVLLSSLIALVDILPILGVGTVLIPWVLWQFIIGNVKFAIALAIVYIFVLIIRQLIEPKLVSKQLGVHPLTTLFSMYAGFKSFGFTGLIIGPIILMILKCIYTKPLEKGFFKELFGDVA